MAHEEQKRKLSDALQALTYSDRSVGVGLAYGTRLAHRAVFADHTRDGQPIPTAAVAREGVIWNPEFVRKCSLAEIVFTIFHETLHEALDHVGLARELGLVDAEGRIIPGKEADIETFGEAADALINTIAERDRIGRLVPGVVKLDPSYDGPLDTRAIYYWLQAHKPQKQPQPQNEQGQGQGQGQRQGQGQGQGQKPDPRLRAPGQGCVPLAHPGPGEGQPEDGDDGQPGQGQEQGQKPGQPGQGQKPGQGHGQKPGLGDAEREMMRATIAQHAGTGSALAEAIAPKKKRSGWREVLRMAAQTVAMDSADRSRPSYARGSRREPLDPGIILPGYVGTEATLCVVLDVSGSMSAHREAIASECLAIARDFPNTRVRLIAHTDRVVFDEWMRPGGDPDAITKATGHTGGTRVAPAYEAARAVRARWDALVHFTDAEVESPWPDAPARRLVIGVTGPASVTGELASEPPAGARIVPVRESA